MERPSNAYQPVERPHETSTVDARKEKLLDEIHTVVKLGIALEKYIAKNPSPTVEGFQDLRTSSIPDWGRELIEGVIIDWQAMCKEIDLLITDITQTLEQRGVVPTETAVMKFLFSTRSEDGMMSPGGKSRLINEGAYLIIEAEDPDDYDYWSMGSYGAKRSSAGEFSHDKQFFTEEKEYRVPVIIMKGCHTDQERERIRVHELQHLINRSFGKIYNNRQSEEDFFVILQDEIIAGIREGETSDRMIERLGGSMELYEQALNGTEEQKEKRGPMLQALKKVLDEPVVKLLFDFPDGRALLSFHLMAASPFGLARRVQYLRDHFLSKMPFLKRIVTEHPLLDLILRDPQFIDSSLLLSRARSHFIQTLRQAMMDPDPRYFTTVEHAHRELLDLLHSAYPDSGEMETEVL